MKLKGNVQQSLVSENKKLLILGGDEMNIWACQGEMSLAEHTELLSVEANFTTGQHSRPLIAMKQDAMTGGYLLTYGDVKIDKATFFDCISIDYFDFDIMKKYDHILNVYKWKGIYKLEEKKLDEEICVIEDKLEEYKKKLENLDASNEKFDYFSSFYKSRIEELDKDIDEKVKNFDVLVEERLMFSGRSLFSFLLPDNFEYSFKNDMSPDGKQVEITRGVMLSGTLNKSVLGSSSGSISHVLFLQYSARVACDFVSYYQMIINRWLLTRGLSVGIEDCVPKLMLEKEGKSEIVPRKDTAKLEEHRKKGSKIVEFTKKSFLCVERTNNKTTNPIKSESAKCFSNALLTIQTEEDKELLELKINNALNNARDICQKLAKDALEPTNSFVSIIRSGAKGNDNNITQITSMLGQQNMEGQRMQLTFGKRTLPHFKRDWENLAKTSEMASDELEYMFQSRGFVSSSFYKGLTPSEFFFHAVGGREGVIDTAIRTADTGYSQRKMIKKLEDLQVNYLGCVETANKSIISFDYGGDNYDGAKIMYKQGKPVFVDVENVCARLNADYEWEQYISQFKTNIEIVEEVEEKKAVETKKAVEKLERSTPKKSTKTEKKEKIEKIESSKTKSTKSVKTEKKKSVKSEQSEKKDRKEKIEKKEDTKNETKEEKDEVVVSPSDIEYFYERKPKDATVANKMREAILINIISLFQKYKNDSKYGHLWTELHKAFASVYDLNDCKIEKYVGRQRYNFIISEKNKRLKVEFKFNCDSVFKFPDVLNLKSTEEIMTASYVEYYYDNYLTKICKIADIKTEIPTRKEYLQLVHKDKTSHPFFTELKEKLWKIDECDEMIGMSIENFLKENLHNVELENLGDELLACFEKEYLMWDLKHKTFVRQIIKDDYKTLKVIDVKNQNTIVVNSNKYSYHILLRWKNKKGVLYPAWQISIKKQE